jgi:hypothetical protein
MKSTVSLSVRSRERRILSRQRWEVSGIPSCLWKTAAVRCQTRRSSTRAKIAGPGATRFRDLVRGVVLAIAAAWHGRTHPTAVTEVLAAVDTPVWIHRDTGVGSLIPTAIQHLVRTHLRLLPVPLVQHPTVALRRTTAVVTAQTGRRAQMSSPTCQVQPQAVASTRRNSAVAHSWPGTMMQEEPRPHSWSGHARALGRTVSVWKATDRAPERIP